MILYSKTFFYFSLLFSLLFLTSSMSAENILLKKGGSIQGKIVEQNQKQIKIKKEDGSIATISKNQILKVIYRDKITKIEEEKLRKAEEAKLNSISEKEKNQIKIEDTPYLGKDSKEKDKYPLGSELEDREDNAEEEEITQLGSVWRSAVLPGWGQYRQDRKLEAYIYPSLVALGIFLTYEQNRIYINSKRDYDNLNNPYNQAGYYRAIIGDGSINSPSINSASELVASELSPFNGQRDSIEKHYRNLQYAGGITVLIYLWNILDAYLFYPKPILKSASFDKLDGRKDNFFIRTSMDTLDALPKTLDLEKRFEPKANFGYSFQY